GGREVEGRAREAGEGRGEGVAQVGEEAGAQGGGEEGAGEAHHEEGAHPEGEVGPCRNRALIGTSRASSRTSSPSRARRHSNERRSRQRRSRRDRRAFGG